MIAADEVLSRVWDTSVAVETRPPDHTERRKVPNQSLANVVKSPTDRSASQALADDSARPRPVLNQSPGRAAV